MKQRKKKNYGPPECGKEKIMINKGIAVLTAAVVAGTLLCSCENFPSDRIAGMMDGCSQNIWYTAGVIKPDLQSVDAVMESMNTERSELTVVSTPLGAVVSFAGNEDFDRVAEAVGDLVFTDPKVAEVVSGGVLAPQTREQAQTFTEKLSEASGSREKMEALKTRLEENVSKEEEPAVRGSMALAGGILENASSKLSASGNGKLQEIGTALGEMSRSFIEAATSEGDLKETDRVQMQIITNATVAAAELAAKTESGTSAEEILETEEAREIVAGIIQYGTVTELAPGAVSVDIEALMNMALGMKEDK